jgi:hypothetical protein
VREVLEKGVISRDPVRVGEMKGKQLPAHGGVGKAKVDVALLAEDRAAEAEWQCDRVPVATFRLGGNFPMGAELRPLELKKRVKKELIAMTITHS